jgi:amino acid transporter
MNATMKSRMVSAATAMAVAAASLLVIAWLATGPGVSIARWSEVWSQHAFPGGIPDAFVEREWSTPGALNARGLLVYEERAEGSLGVCLPGLVGLLVISAAAVLVHAAVCMAVASLSRRSADRTAKALALPHARFYRISAVAALSVPIAVCALRWFWAGAERGSITQRVVGGSHVEFVFGPFGRFAVLLGSVLLYLALTTWIARRLAVPTDPAAKHPRPLAAITLLVCATVLLLFPFWGPQTACLMSQTTAMKLGQWSETTSLRGVLDELAPMP